MHRFVHLFKRLKTDAVAMILVSLFFMGPVPALGEGPEITEISIATPQWDGQTNKDGTGLFFEIVRNIYEPEGINVRYGFYPWKRAQMMVSAARADAMLCVWKAHSEAEKQCIPDYPMFVEYTGAVFKKGRFENREVLKELDGKSAVWLRGYDYHTASYLKNIKLKNRCEVDDYSQAWKLIDEGRYDVYIDALIDLNQYIRNNKLDMTPYGLEILWGEKAYIAFSDTEKSQKLIEIYDRRIIKLHKSGRLKRIYDKWHVRYPGEAWAD